MTPTKMPDEIWITGGDYYYVLPIDGATKYTRANNQPDDVVVKSDDIERIRDAFNRLLLLVDIDKRPMANYALSILETALDGKG